MATPPFFSGGEILSIYHDLSFSVSFFHSKCKESCYNKKSPAPKGAGLSLLLIKLLAVLTGSLRLLATLDARALVVLTLAHFGQDARLGAAALEALERVLQGLAVLHTDFRH